MYPIKRFSGSDIEIAQAVFPEHALHIAEAAKKAGIPDEYIDYYGKFKAKIDCNFLLKNTNAQKGKLILVTAITPTPAGEGKTTTTVGLADALSMLGKKTVAALREPSLGPVFGMKGGAAGGGWAQVIPMEDINLHFTGDFHAISAANNLLAALIDNHIYQGNALNIDPRKIVWRRCMDMNDRQLRFINNGLGGKANGVPREDGFDITAASEIMAVFCLASGIEDLKERLGRIIIGYTYGSQSEGGDKPVIAAQLNAQGAMAVLLKDAFKPNLVQTLEGTPVFIHGGPFANIAHGCNSVMAARMAMQCADYVVTEAGFGADLGAEKFIDIKCRSAGLQPSAAVVVATIKALKSHGGFGRNGKENIALEKDHFAALEAGLPNLLQHLENITQVYKLPAVLAINAFPEDALRPWFKKEMDLIETKCRDLGVNVVLSEVWAKGGEGGVKLAEETLKLCEKPGFSKPGELNFVYDINLPIKEKIKAIAQKIYRAKDISVLPDAQKHINRLEKLGFGSLPVCMAKTQYSFSDNPSLQGTPKDWTLTVRDVKISAGAGFIVVFTGNIMTMPGLPALPSAEKIDLDPSGTISGLF